MRLLAPVIVFASSLLLAAPAFANDNGEGIVGETDDRMITFFCLGLVIFFPVLITLLTLLQDSLERRKAQRKATELRRRVGW
jgi:hypothetical protein